MHKASQAHEIDRLNATLSLDEDVIKVKGVSPARVSILERLGIYKVRDLLTHYPRRYMDLSKVSTIAGAQIGDSCTITADVYDIVLKRKPHLPIVEITLTDSTGTLIVTVFRQPWLMNKISKGERIAIAGKVEFNYGFKRMTNPIIEPVVSGNAEGKIIPIHPATEKLSAKIIRNLVESALLKIRGIYDPMPSELRIKHELMAREEALKAIHFPKALSEAASARKRLAYEELLLLQLYTMKSTHERNAQFIPIKHVANGDKVKSLDQVIPFKLTSDQRKAIDEIFTVLAKDACADHMLLGDVGCGKTIVAAFAMAAAIDSSTQAMLLAPTEVLATQHDQAIGELFDKIGISHALLTGSTPKDERGQILQNLKDGSLDVLIGTHALLEDDVVAKRVGLFVIDEQQRFGVDQRASFLSKGPGADALYLTATPIPRTLALALFGNLTLSYLSEKPNVGSNRTTKVLPRTLSGEAYDAALHEVEKGRQVYVVCPLIGAKLEKDEKKSKTMDLDSEKFHPDVAIDALEDETKVDLTSAKKKAQTLENTVFSGYNVGLLHGGLPASEKAKIMKDFKEGLIDVLVSTTVIEVGVDVPNATVMIIEDADRFGLSQLHQLRGRIGRGKYDGQAFMISSSKSEDAIKRLSALERSNDGFELAKYDLALRKEGDMLGNRQSGASSLKLVNIFEDAELIEAAHLDALKIMGEDANLATEEHAALAREIRMVFSEDAQTMGA